MHASYLPQFYLHASYLSQEDKRRGGPQAYACLMTSTLLWKEDEIDLIKIGPRLMENDFHIALEAGGHCFIHLTKLIDVTSLELSWQWSRLIT